MMSAPEVEFSLSRQGGQFKPLFSGRMCRSTCVKGLKPYMFDVVKKLSEANIPVKSWHLEWEPGQVEVNLNPQFGIESIDTWHFCREAIKHTASEHDFVATFMSQPLAIDISGNGAHFNHSLWESPTVNQFWSEGGENNLSDMAHHWLAGLIAHAPAMTAICNPTVNCYRRLFRIERVMKATWGLDVRFATYRVKNLSKKATYIESRLPSSAANPYLVLAVHIAAGMDGIKNKLPLPTQMDAEGPKIPSTLAEALVALREDKVIAEAMGDLLLNWFCELKEEVEVKMLQPSSSVLTFNSRESQAEREREFYLDI